ncbi:hypothetical protein RDI58_004508 [Solanum bulbocastanum]|uniref:Uncharacterized protein n=1 Tax=Solanum bulbocastanum TaxID=147425 RepID=A0AAN8U6N3_SOLBU
MNERGKIHPTFIKIDRHTSLYMLDIGIDGSRSTLRINVHARPPIEPTNWVIVEMRIWVITQ